MKNPMIATRHYPTVYRPLAVTILLALTVGCNAPASVDSVEGASNSATLAVKAVVEAHEDGGGPRPSRVRIGSPSRSVASVGNIASEVVSDWISVGEGGGAVVPGEWLVSLSDVRAADTDNVILEVSVWQDDGHRVPSSVTYEITLHRKGAGWTAVGDPVVVGHALGRRSS